MDRVQLMLAAKILLGTAAAAGLWFGIRPLMRRDWDNLARAFDAQALPEGQRFSSVSGEMGSGLSPVHARGLWTVVVTSSGFGMSTLSVFGKTPTLFIPWSSVESVFETRVPFTNAAIVRIRGQWPTICIHGAAGAAMAQAYQGLTSKREA
jgi:hypothetical protein